jgi:hypothetical protein
MPQKNALAKVRVTTNASDIAPFVVRGVPTISCTYTGDVDKRYFEMWLDGLEEPYVFKKLVDSKLAITHERLSVELAEIRNELKRHNDLLEVRGEA